MATAARERIGHNRPLRRLTEPAAAFFFTIIAGLALPGHAYAVCQLIADAPYRSPAPGEARVWQAALAVDEVQIRYIGHSTFELETPQGVRIATDYNDSIRPLLPPTVATMNGAHSTHYSVNPSPDIEHLLFGWNPQGGPIDHDLTVQDVRIRNIQTNIRGWDGESRRLGNSIFVFEVADLCIAHLGHLHHRLTQEDLTRLGQIDIVFAAIDNSSTLRLESLMHVLDSVGPAMVIPMHFHFAGALQSFMGRATEAGYEVIRADTPKLIVSRAGLPLRKTVYIMMPGGA
ncbi:MBL fold metallo-hydrolase [Labrenzia sp. OB1]|uniref:MBL fold metallo-hydrolase n=1 Tax=Labrenzia sp. OB1 TaxID=1561204 RepID=UPI0009ED8386|nr:MBL fold metallo-hydrolase [Labrenzia sp. OB1]